MNEIDICYRSVVDLAQDVRTKTLSPVEITDAFIKRIESVDHKLNAYCLPMFDIARDKAKRAEEAQMRGEFWGPLHGVPYAIKDCDDYKGLPTTFGAKPLKDHIAQKHSVHIERIENAGAIPLGKTTTPDMAWMGLTRSTLFGESYNPWSLAHNPGGSSGGSAAAVAAGLASFATGSDGAGSIRIPASFCGIYGLKASFGRVPFQSGNVNQHTHLGPMTRTVLDTALTLGVMAGPSDFDQMSLECPPENYLDKIERPMEGIRIGWSSTLGFVKNLDAEVLKSCEEAVEKFRALGCIVEEVDLDLTGIAEIAKRHWQALMSAHAVYRLGDHISDFDPALVACAKLAGEQRSGELLHDKMKQFALYLKTVEYFERFDFLLTPTTACLPVSAGKLVPDHYRETDWDWMEWAPYSSAFNLFHNPAASIPCGFSKSGLPIGIQLVGRRHDDLGVMQVSNAFERMCPWTNQRPPL